MSQGILTSNATQQIAKAPSRTRLIIAATLGNTLELFDFTVFSLFAPIIATLYFPSDSAYGSLLLAVGVFGVGFIMRPLGSIVLGAYADRVGRKAAMLLTILLMGVGTSTIALAPTHAQIGIFAPIMIVIGRLLQGFSAGGEIGAATALLMESAERHNRGFFVSWQMVSQGFSVLLGSSCGILLTNLLSEEALHTWGWRLPFLLGLTVIPMGLYIRQRLDETLHQEKEDVTQAPHSPLHQFLRDHWQTFVLGVAFIMSTTLLSYIILFYMPTYMTQVAHLSSSTSYLMNVGTGIVMSIASLAAGLWLDRLAWHKPLAIVALVIATLLIYPTFLWLSSPHTLWLAFASRMILVAALGISATANILLVIEALPRAVRATGMALTYALSVAAFGGTAQFIVTWLIKVTDNPMAPAWYLIGMLTICLLAFIPFHERHLD